jgi:hypothetical protein
MQDAVSAAQAAQADTARAPKTAYMRSRSVAGKRSALLLALAAMSAGYAST